MVSRLSYMLTAFLPLVTIVICTLLASTFSVDLFVISRRSSSSTPENNQITNIILDGRISGEEEAEDFDYVEKQNLVLKEEDKKTEEEMYARPPIVVVTEDFKQRPVKPKPNRKRYLVSRSALRQKLINGVGAAENKEEEPLLLMKEAVSSPFDSRSSLNSLATSKKEVAEATAALLNKYHASIKKNPVRLCGLKLANRTKEICKNCQPAHLRPLFLVEKKRGGTFSAISGNKNVDKLTEMCCVRRCTDETIRQLCCSEED